MNKFEQFDVNRAIDDFQSGGLERVTALPDFGPAHRPHVDLTVRPTGGDTIKYRIYDQAGAEGLRSDFGNGGLDLIR